MDHRYASRLIVCHTVTEISRAMVTRDAGVRVGKAADGRFTVDYVSRFNGGLKAHTLSLHSTEADARTAANAEWTATKQAV